MSRGQNLTYYLKNLITFNLRINVCKKLMHLFSIMNFIAPMMRSSSITIQLMNSYQLELNDLVGLMYCS